MSRELRTFDDLYDFFVAQGKDVVFDAQKNHCSMTVQQKAYINFAKRDAHGLLPVHLQSCHLGKNTNNYMIDKDVMEAAIPTFANKPILGFIYEGEDGEPHFHCHDRHKDENNQVVHDESPVGIIPESNNAQLVFDDEKGKTYLEIDGYIYEDYSKAAEILKREGECACSVELDVHQLIFDAKNRAMNITDFDFMGVTILGEWADGTPIEPGMEGSNIQIADFQKKDSPFDNETLIAKIDKLQANFDQMLADFSINSKKGGNESQMTKFEELLNKYEKTAEDVTFEHEGLSDEELEAKFAEAFGSTEKPITKDVPGKETKSGAENVVDDKSSDPADKPSDEPIEGSDDSNASLTFSYKDREGNVAEFAITLDEKRSALSKLVNEAYGDENHHFGLSDVYEGEDEADNYLIMDEWLSGEAFKQSYAVNGDHFSLIGERIPVSAMWVTDDEKTAIEAMRTAYPTMEEKLRHFEEEPQKLEILNSKEYAGISDTAEFAALKDQEAHFSLTVDEVRGKADAMLLTAAKQGTLNFEKQDAKVSPSRKPLPVSGRNGTGKYGMLFANK